MRSPKNDALIANVVEYCEKALLWAERRDYAGYGKFDALNSPLLNRFSKNNKYLRMGVTYLVSRSPINLRPLLRTELRQNPKALGLFARSYFNLYDILGNQDLLIKGEALLSKLLEYSQISEFSGHCWGSEYPRQSTKFYLEPYFPGAVVTVEVAEAYLDAYQITNKEKYLSVAISAGEFIRKDIMSEPEGEDRVCYGYYPGALFKVINANAKIAGFLSRLGRVAGDTSLLDEAKKIMNWVASRQLENGAWFYADPASASHVAHDNYHTAFVLDSIFQYIEYSEDIDFRDVFNKGLEFYELKLFMPNGAPKWRSNKNYPFDIHGAAQGILVFSRSTAWDASNWELVEKILAWVNNNMRAEEGRYYFQKDRFWTKKYTLMRWCQAWMSYALSVMATEAKQAGAAKT